MSDDSKTNVVAIATPRTPKRRAALAAAGDDWTASLQRNAKGQLRKSLANVATIVACDPRWVGVLAYDAFGEEVVTLKPAPTRPQDAPAVAVTGSWSDEDSIRTSTWVSAMWGIDVGTNVVDQAIAAVARRHVIHPVRDYLHGLKWDGVARLDGLLATYFGTDDSAYTRGVGSRWMISAVARIMRPGCQADCTLVLESLKQGTGKSTGIEALAGAEWSADTGITVGDKDSYQSLRRKWIYELGELAAVKGRDVERVKNFLSARSDNYRPSYGRRNRDFLRQVVFCGTTNETTYLADKTGNRRFWCVRCVRTVDVAGIRRDRDHLWAEARARYAAGEAWHVNTREFAALCSEQQAERVANDPWEQIVARWIESPTITRHDAAHGVPVTTKLDPKAGFLTSEVLLGALQKRPGDITRGDEMRVGIVLRTLGFEPGSLRRENGERVRRYVTTSPKRDEGSASGCDTQGTTKRLDSLPSQLSQPYSTYTYENSSVAISNSDPDRGSDGCDNGTSGGSK